jgi:5-methyltetrahydropteroyltriglutamate--homocysteine methyltransferase
MTARSNPPFHAEHIGSLLRPDEMRRAFRSFSTGEMSAGAFKAVQDRCIRDAVAMQEEIGLQSITDGEFRRTSYWSHFVEAVDGLGVAPARFRFRDDAGEEMEFLSPHVEGKVRRSRSYSTEELQFLLSVTDRTPKLTMPSPPTMHFWSGSKFVDNGIYPSEEAYFADLIKVYRDEIADVAAAGAHYIQVDEVPLAMLCDPSLREALQVDGEDPGRRVNQYIDLMNACFHDRGAVTIGLHLCRGNFKGQWLTEGGYDFVAERMFNELDVDVFFMEYDTPRAGDFAPLRHVPTNKSVVLGLISSKTPVLEDMDELRRRIDEAAGHTALERLGISPQCGFASAVTGNPVTYDDQIAKLRLVVETAEKVWG